MNFKRPYIRANSLLSFDSWDLRGSGRADKERLEFRVKVTEGSSDCIVALAKPLGTIGTNIINRMTPEEVLIAVLTIALLTAGVIGWKAWLSARTEQRKAESSKEETKAWLDQQRQVMDHDERMAGLLKEAIIRQPVLGDVDAAIEPARQQIVRAVGEERGGTVQGVALSPQLASELVTQKRQQAETVRFSGTYRVSRVDTTLIDGFRVTLTDVENGAEVSAALQDAVSSEVHRERIRDAEWSKRPIRVSLVARQLRGRYIDAVVQGVDLLASNEDKPSQAASGQAAPPRGAA